MVEFVGMSRAEAKEYLAPVLGEMDAGLRRVMDEASASGGPTTEAWDRTPVSLAPVWEWAVPRLSWRAGYEPPGPGDAGSEDRGRPARAGRPAAVLVPPPQRRLVRQVSAGTLWLIDGLGRYLGETVLATVPGRPGGGTLPDQGVHDPEPASHQRPRRGGEPLPYPRDPGGQGAARRAGPGVASLRAVYDGWTG